MTAASYFFSSSSMTALKRSSGWAPEMNFEAGLQKTFNWYRESSTRIARVRSGEYRTYFEKHYVNGLAGAADKQTTPVMRRKKSSPAKSGSTRRKSGQRKKK